MGAIFFLNCKNVHLLRIIAIWNLYRFGPPAEDPYLALMSHDLSHDTSVMCLMKACCRCSRINAVSFKKTMLLSQYKVQNIYKCATFLITVGIPRKRVTLPLAAWYFGKKNWSRLLDKRGTLWGLMYHMLMWSGCGDALTSEGYQMVLCHVTQLCSRLADIIHLYLKYFLRVFVIF